MEPIFCNIITSDLYIFFFCFIDFSLTTWLANNSIGNVSDLMQTDYKVSQLMDELSISQYLLSQSCSQSTIAVNGWTSCKTCWNYEFGQILCTDKGLQCHSIWLCLDTRKHHYSHRLDFLNKFAACAKMVIKPNISGAVCHLKEDCTSLECCVGVEYLTRNIKSFLTIDPCTSELQVGIGKFSRNISLAHYRWGTVELLNNWFA